MKPDIITDYYLEQVEDKIKSKKANFFLFTWGIFLLSMNLFGHYFYLLDKVLDKVAFGLGSYIIMGIPIIVQFFYGKYLKHRYE